MLDFLGNPITVGCYVAYVWRRGSASGLKKMHVLGIDRNGWLHGCSTLGRPLTIKNTGNCIIVPAPGPNKTFLEVR